MKKQIINILSGFGIPESAITNQTNFSRDLGLDSLDIVDLMIQLEKTFGISIPDEDWDKLTTFQSVLTYLKAEQAVG